MLKRRHPPVRFAELRDGIKRVFGHVAPYLRKYRALALGAGGALLGATVFRLAEPWPLKFVIDSVLSPGAVPSFLASFSQEGLLALCAGLALGVIAIRALFEYLATIGFALAGSRVLGELRYDLYCHLQRLSLGFHDRARTGDLTVRVVNDVSSMREAMVTALLPFTANVLIIVSMALVMVILDWRLALVALAPLPLLGLTTVKLGGKIQKVSREQRKREGSVAAMTAETLGGMREVQALSLEDRMSRVFQQSNSGSLAGGVKAKRLAAALERSTDLLAGISTAGTLWYGSLLVIRGELTVGDLVVFLAYLKYTFRPIRNFAKNSSRIAKATAAGERIADLLEVEPQIRESPDAFPAPRLSGHIRFDSVHFSHMDGAPVLSGFDLDIEPREMVALVGPSGAGKSTVASLLLRLYDPDAGSISIDGTDIRRFTLSSLRAQIGVVLQDHLILADTVAANIALAAPKAAPSEIEAAARLAGAHEFIIDLPEGYDTLLAERGASLSVGQRQRLVLARAALRPSPIIVFDEPSTGLDPNSEALVRKAISSLAEDATVIVITHDMSLASLADRVLVLGEGRIVESGSPSRLLSLGGIYASMCGHEASDRGKGRNALAG